MIDTVVFDLGKVLVDFKWEEIYQQHFNQQEYIRAANATILHPKIWKHLDKNDIPYDAFLSQIKKAEPELYPRICDVIDQLYEELKPYDYAYDWLKSLSQQGHKIYILSNFGEKPFLMSKKHFDFMTFIDGALISYQVQQIKPEKEIYQTLMHRYQIEPCHAVFIDDVLENVDAARKLGFQGILFKDYESASIELERILSDD